MKLSKRIAIIKNINFKKGINEMYGYIKEKQAINGPKPKHFIFTTLKLFFLKYKLKN